MPRTEPKESEIQSAICEYLTARGAFFIRLNNIPALFVNAKGEKQFRSLGKYARAGMADLLVVRSGHAIFLEVKRPHGKQSADQVDFERAAFRAEADYHVVRSIDDIQALGL